MTGLAATAAQAIKEKHLLMTNMISNPTPHAFGSSALLLLSDHLLLVQHTSL
jgi:hypothetical protein